ncbi:MAG: polysaccharide deacetylase [Clostridiales bacterium]|nr:polysaccharide deacetylase [Clostridiales bacterium]
MRIDISYQNSRKKKLKKWVMIGSATLIGFISGIVLTCAINPKQSNSSQENQVIAEEQQSKGNEPTEDNLVNQDLTEKTNSSENMNGTSDQDNRNVAEKPTETNKENHVEEPEIIEEKEYVGVSEAGLPYAYDAQLVADKLAKYDYSNEEKVVFLTFDDGTSSTVTPKVLDILKEYDVKATFFLVGKTIEDGGEKAKELVKREFEEGHAIANHTYSHSYRQLYPDRTLNLSNFVEDLEKTDHLLKEILGENFSTRVFRCPGGYMSWKSMSPLKDYQKENNRVSIDWNSLIKDAEGKKKNESELFDCMIETSQDKDMVVLLMHDTYGKEETAKVLPRIIKHFKEKGYVFKTLV